MKHQSVGHVETVASVHRLDATPMTAVERLERWARLLEKEPERRLSTLRETEFQSRRTREALRADGSPISVAFADPVLRVDGLTGDTYGEARQFFELSHQQMHDALCYCHFGQSMSAGESARALRRIIASKNRGGFLGWLGRGLQTLRRSA